MLRARRSASRLVSSSISRRRRPAWWRASCSTSAISSCLAWAALRPEIRSSSRRCTRLACFSSSSSWARLRSRSSSAWVRRSRSARWTSSDSVVRSARSSIRAISSRRARSSSVGRRVGAAGSAGVGAGRRDSSSPSPPRQPKGACGHPFLSAGPQAGTRRFVRRHADGAAASASPETRCRMSPVRPGRAPRRGVLAVSGAPRPATSVSRRVGRGSSVRSRFSCGWRTAVFIVFPAARRAARAS